MNCKFLGVKGTWREIANAANTTIAKEAGDKVVSSLWKKRMLLCEHSPIRQLIVKWKWYELPYWTSVHIVRHWLGIVHWVRTQRSDRTGIDRDSLPQDAPVEHEIEANSQALINISRKRLCMNASPKTRKAWAQGLFSFRDKEPELFSVCVKECVYRNGLCPEFKSCGYNMTEDFEQELKKYTEIVKFQINNNANIHNKGCKIL